jgi:hypothetical protein
MPVPHLCHAPDANLTHRYKGMFAGNPARVLGDTGATHVFASEEFVRGLGLPIGPARHAKVTLADGGASAILGECQAKLSLDRFHTRTSALVLTDMPPGIDLILGDAFFRKHLARFEYNPPSLVLRKATETYRVLADRAPTASPPRAI